MTGEKSLESSFFLLQTRPKTFQNRLRRKKNRILFWKGSLDPSGQKVRKDKIRTHDVRMKKS